MTDPARRRARGKHPGVSSDRPSRAPKGAARRGDPGGSGVPSRAEREAGAGKPAQPHVPEGPGQQGTGPAPGRATADKVGSAARWHRDAGRKAQESPERDRSPQAILALYRPDLAGILASADAPAFRHMQVLEHLSRHPEAPFAEATNLPAGLRDGLEGAGTCVLSLAARREAADGTVKFLLETRDELHVEAVVMPYGRRTTVCVSSQAGCPVGCEFCATGALGFQRNLSAAEIVDQVRVAMSEVSSRISNVVYMGMGEPLLNLQPVLDSVRVLTAPSGLGLGHRSISISTVGIPRGILRLARTEPQVNLAISLHAADDATRALLIPDQYRHPLSEILEAAWQHFAITRRKLLIEYVLLAGVNDSPDDARRLAGLLRGHVVTVNLLTWNPVGPLEPSTSGSRKDNRRPKVGLSPPNPAAVAAFRATLQAAHVDAVVRQSKGGGIEAACGQLAGRVRSYGME